MKFPGPGKEPLGFFVSGMKYQHSHDCTAETTPLSREEMRGGGPARSAAQYYQPGRLPEEGLVHRFPTILDRFFKSSGEIFDVAVPEQRERDPAFHRKVNARLLEAPVLAI